LVCSIHPLTRNEEDIKISLEGLINSDIIKEVGDGQYEFRNIVSQEVGYNQMLFAHRRLLHQNIGKWYEKEMSDVLSNFYPLLAHHWVRAENHDKSFEYLEKAGMQALSNHGHSEAAYFLSQAIQVLLRIYLLDNTILLTLWHFIYH
jgi:predicted ATPase